VSERESERVRERERKKGLSRFLADPKPKYF